MEERPLPKPSWQRRTVLVFAFFAFTAVVEWLAIRLDSHLLMYLPLIVACGFVFYKFRRCPICHRRLRADRKTLEGTEYRIVYECDLCQIVWDSGLIGDSKLDSSD